MQTGTGAGAGVFSPSSGVIGGDHLYGQRPLHWKVERLLGCAAHLLAASVGGDQTEGLVD